MGPECASAASESAATGACATRPGIELIGTAIAARLDPLPGAAVWPTVAGRPTGPTRPQHSRRRGTHDRTGADPSLSHRLIEVDDPTAD